MGLRRGQRSRPRRGERFSQIIESVAQRCIPLRPLGKLLLPGDRVGLKPFVGRVELGEELLAAVVLDRPLEDVVGALNALRSEWLTSGTVKGHRQPHAPDAGFAFAELDDG